MALINENYLKLPEYYFFNEIQQKVNAHKIINPKANVISLGLGDVSRPIPASALTAMKSAVEELSDAKTFKGYGPETGYSFLKNCIIKETITCFRTIAFKGFSIGKFFHSTLHCR